MATALDYIVFVCEQIDFTYMVRYRKMFGEYMVYVNDKPILLVCDNTVYVKQAKELGELLMEADIGCPYQGAKEHYILDIENHRLVNDVIAVLEPITSLPKPRKKKG